MRQERRVSMGRPGRNPTKNDIGLMFSNIQCRFTEGNEVSFDERADILDLLFEIYQELNTLKPMGRNYKSCFDATLIDEFIETIKIADNYNGKNFSIFGTHIISWLEDYKKTYLNEKFIAPKIDKTK